MNLNAHKLHPVLFAVYPVVYLLGENAQEGNLADAALLAAFPLLLALGAMALLSRAVFRSAEKAAVATTLGLVLFFSYGHVYSMVRSASELIGRQRYLVPAFILVFLVACWWIRRREESKGGERAKILNIVGLALIALSMVNLLSHRAPVAGLTPEVPAGWLRPGVEAAESKPDVFFLVLDGYGRADVLRENFGIDNSNFLGQLGTRGFAVGTKSFSPYSSTALSLASSLNLGFVDGREGLLAGAEPEPDKLRELTRNNRFFRLMASYGYKRYAIARRADFLPSLDPPEELFNCGSSREFVEALLDTTMARVVKNVWGGFTAGQRRKTIECQFEALKSVTNEPGPKLVFFHSLITHPPFLFHADGSPRPVDDAVARKWRPWRPHNEYEDQVILTNRRVLELVDRMIEASPDSVIIIQGDHGPKGSRDWKGDTVNDARERLAILNAVRMPLADAQPAADGVPLNTFRRFLAIYFGAEVEPLPERLVIESEYDGGSLIDVTRFLRPSPEEPGRAGADT